MQRCLACGAEFPVSVVVNGVKLDLHGRKHCLACRPHRPLRAPRKPVHRPPKELRCVLCGKAFPAKQLVDGRMRSLYRRSFCLDCSPFGAHNTSRSPVSGPDADARKLAKRKRRLESYRRSLNKRRRRRKRELVEARGGACVDCGYAVCPDALQFHHRDPKTRDFRLGEFNGSLARFLAEAAKCDLVCANCHRLRHALEATTSRHRIVTLRRQMKARAVAAFGGACAGCGGIFPAGVYDFHHPSARDKDFALSSDGIYRAWAAVAAELAKCVMICANCHAEVHAGTRVLAVAPGFPPDGAAGRTTDVA